ncbi:MAG: lipoyl synthase [Candidatus Omnitrophota bacterium]
MVNRLPEWFRQKIPGSDVYEKINQFKQMGISTVCQQARCPNQGDCFAHSRFTFLIMGNTCTRDCLFCGVKKAKRPSPLDMDEPERVSRAVEELDLDFVVITSVSRDDLPDAGAGHFAKTIKLIRKNRGSQTRIEVLIPDFSGNLSSLNVVLDAAADVVAHNLETVARLYPYLRPQADYRLCLHILARIKEIRPQVLTKSSLMLGLGENEEEVIKAMQDLLQSSCDILTLGQYLSPGRGYYPVAEFIAPEIFQKYREIARGLGFKSVLSEPLARSSFQAAETYRSLTSCTT